MPRSERYVAYQRDYQQRYRLPDQIDRAERRLLQLYRQAERIGMIELVPPEHLTSTGE